MTAAKPGGTFGPGPGRVAAKRPQPETPDAPGALRQKPAPEPRPRGKDPGMPAVRARVIPVFRANPYPEVTDLICRLPLPTLIYRLETLNLGDLLRIRYKLLRVCVPQSSIFKVQEENIDTAI